jgi:signal peptidase I
MMLFVNWFLSRTVRHAWQAANHVGKILHHQRDLLSPDAINAVDGDIAAVRAACRAGDKKVIHDTLAKLEKSANKWLKPYPHAAWRENIEVALVAIAVAMAIRTFFLQPFKIPTGSMQPTLYGVTPGEYDLPGSQEDLSGQPLPGGMARFFDYWFNGVQYFHLVAQSSGTLTWDEPTKAVLFNLKQTYRIDGAPQPPIWFPPDFLFKRAGVAPGTPVTAGGTILKLRVISGDHLFVDRVTFNFRRPTRGDIVVFETHGIQELAEQSPGLADTYYIKRLCGLGGERISLRTNCEVLHPYYGPLLAGHLVVNGTNEITAVTPHFENLYSFNEVPYRSAMALRTNRALPKIDFHENHYYGHALLRRLMPGAEYPIPPNHFFVMGDNTFNSSDSRYWGDFDQTKVIGKSFFVYWPIGGTTYKGEKRESRFGWAHR